MLDLDRVTTVYSPEEDRIALTGELRSGSTARIWLTQRMGTRLVESLVKVLTPQHADAGYVEAISAVAQRRVADRIEPQAPVSSVALSHEWLVNKIDLHLATAGAVLIFHGPDEAAARIAMTNELLRQWLGILHKGYVSGDWTGPSWPVWIEPAARPVVGVRVLH